MIHSERAKKRDEAEGLRADEGNGAELVVQGKSEIGHTASNPKLLIYRDLSCIA